MKTSTKIGFGVAGAVVAYDSVVAVIMHRRINRMKRSYEKLLAERNDCARLANLWAKKLNELHIPIDDFERIIMEETTPR